MVLDMVFREKCRTAIILVIMLLPAIVNIYAQGFKPIEGALVVASGDAGYGMAKTDVSGFFEIVKGLGEGVYEVTVTAKGYISKTLRNVKVEADKVTDLGDIELTPSAVIKGVVETPEGKPAASVPVILKASDGVTVSTTITASDGSFIFDTDVVNGTYSIEAYAFSFEGFEFQMMKLGLIQIPLPVFKGGASYLKGYTSGVVYDVEAVQGEVTKDVVVRLGVSGVISGRVTDEQGNPVAEVFVIAYPSEWTEGASFRGFFAWTGSDGSYRIANNLPTGDYNVTILFPKGYVWKFTEAKTVHVEAGEETSNVDFQLERSGIISGIVVYADDTPAANVTVLASSEDGEYFSFAFTGIDGSFKMDSGLGTATYQVIAYGGDMLFSEPKTVQVKAGEETKGVKLVLNAPARAMAAVEGTVVDEDGNPIEGAEVYVPGETAYTGADGAYRLTVALPPGETTAEVTVTASKRGYKTTSKVVTLEAGKVETGVDFTLESIRLGVIKGRVVTRLPVPPPKKTVELSIDLSATSITIGQSVTISGTTTPAVTGEVSIYVASDDVFTEVAKVPIEDGGYSYEFTPPSVGAYRIKVSFPGNEEYEPAESEILTLVVVKRVVKLSMSISHGKISLGNSITIEGDVSPTVTGNVSIMVAFDEVFEKIAEVQLEDGRFSYVFTPGSVGSYRIKVVWPGDEEHEPAESEILTLVVTKVAPKLFLTLSLTEITVGESVTVEGSISPILEGKVSILVAFDTVFEKVAEVNLKNGRFSYTFKPPSTGTYRIKASFPGDEEHEPAESTILTLTVVRKLVTVSVSLSSTSITIGDSVTIEGSLSPALTGKVQVLVASDDLFEKVAEVDITDGRFSYVFTPDEAGVYRVKIAWLGSEEYKPAESKVVTLTVVKISPAINISVSKTKVNVGETITISGSITPFKAETKVIIVIVTPTAVEEHEVTSSDGKFEYSLKLDAKGVWRVKVRVPESRIYTSAESDEVKITVEEKRCIIATATFGSEVSPEVVFLRSFRDQFILKTHAGRRFYVAFNAFYYSWSTPVAAFIELNPALKTLVKLLIYPLLGILKFTATVTIPLFRLNPEAAAIFAGFIASSLIGVIYVSPILATLSFIAKKFDRKLSLSTRFVKTVWLLTIASVVFTVLSLTTGSNLLLTVSTSIYVLANIASASTSTLSLLAGRL